MAGESHSTAARLLSTQRAINSHLAALKPPEQLVPDVIRTICETLGWSFGIFWAPVAEGDMLEVGACWHRPAAPLEQFAELSRSSRVKRGEGLLGSVWESRAPVWLEDARQPGTPRSRAVVEAGFESAFAFPLTLAEHSLGMLEFLSHERREADPELIDNFQLVGIQLAQYLERWRGLEE